MTTFKILLAGLAFASLSIASPVDLIDRRPTCDDWLWPHPRRFFFSATQASWSRAADHGPCFMVDAVGKVHEYTVTTDSEEPTFAPPDLVELPHGCFHHCEETELDDELRRCR